MDKSLVPMDATGSQSPSNSRNSNRNPYVHPSTYPSPAKSEAENTDDALSGLGLCEYTIAYQNQLTPAMYPMSPHPTEGWTPSLTAGSSPGMMDGQMRCWNDSYDAMSRSPMHWEQSFTYATGVIPAKSSPAPFDLRMLSQRSSISSSYDSSPYSQDGSDFAPVKLETQGKWMSDEEATSSYTVTQQPMTVSPDRLATGSAHAVGLSKTEYSYDESNTSRMTPVSNSGADGGANAGQEVNTSTARTRSRSTTTAENANYQCRVCGKLFKRGSNHKAHLETHNPDRPYPHSCPYKGCDKEFVRRTDLCRHEQSVHIRARNHRCTACDAHFARKDTLRRHTEDGCPKRFESNKQEGSPSSSRGRATSGSTLPIRHVSHHGRSQRSQFSPLGQAASGRHHGGR